MSQRKALIASLVITLVLALSAIGIRAAMVDSPDAATDSPGTLTLVQPGSEIDDDDLYEDSDDAYEESDDDESVRESDDDGHEDAEDHDEEDGDDAE